MRQVRLLILAPCSSASICFFPGISGDARLKWKPLFTLPTSVAAEKKEKRKVKERQAYFTARIYFLSRFFNFLFPGTQSHYRGLRTTGKLSLPKASSFYAIQIFTFWLLWVRSMLRLFAWQLSSWYSSFSKAGARKAAVLLNVFVRWLLFHTFWGPDICRNE